MKTFFGGVFIDRKTLEDAGINHPIKIEYYKGINEEELLKNNKEKYGISIIKTEYKKDETKVEESGIKYLTNSEKTVDFILNILKQNNVTPIGLKDVICDFGKQIL